eukprot:TRINITY_DN21126_c0_g1_i1.p1 TRINITY_DN21126_c0_g1~~TRINITY_DN21126_c0_g1_i1.p1  ORF type:complete len:166 (+),score=54.51 TRINITY_DN21126_c0_g1_i1:63-560(+)
MCIRDRKSTGLSEELTKAQEEIAKLKQELTEIKSRRRSSIIKPIEKKVEVEESGSFEDEYDDDDDEGVEANPAQKIVLPRVIAEDVAPHGLELSQRLRCLRIPLEDAERALVARLKPGVEEISITKLVHTLHDEPFDVEEETCVLLARYMVEDCLLYTSPSPRDS